MVRSAHITDDQKVLATVSEDCMIKLWNLTDLEQRWTESKGNVEPYLTLRGHTGPLFCSSGRSDLLFTAGLEGVVKMWQIPPVG